MKDSSEYLFFAQHGWADNSQDISRLAQELIRSNNSILIAPSLGRLKTWIRIEPLIKRVEKIATETINQYPHLPIRIMGHSMGGLIWLEVLNRNFSWWQKVHSLVLIGSPIGGANVARIIDPLEIGIGIAKDLGKNRRLIAEKIAQHIPTLNIAGDINSGSDGLVTVGATKFSYCQFIIVSGIAHAALKCHPRLVPIIQDFWANPQITPPPKPNLASKLIRKLQAVPGMTDGHKRNFAKAKVYLRFPEGINILTWKNPLGVDHVFLADSEGDCLYAGYVGWSHSQQLRQTLTELKQQLNS